MKTQPYQKQDFSQLGQFLLPSVSCVYGWVIGSVTRLGDLLDIGQLFKAFGNN